MCRGSRGELHAEIAMKDKDRFKNMNAPRNIPGTDGPVSTHVSCPVPQEF